MIDDMPFYYLFPTYFSNNYFLWQHNMLNFGVLVSKDIWHEVPVYISNQSQKPLFLTNIRIEFDNEDFEVMVATNYKYGIPLPF